MFWKLFFILALVSLASAKAPGEAQAVAELKNAGMSQGSIDGLMALSEKYPMGGSNQKVKEEFNVENQKVLDGMPEKDRETYEEFKKKRSGPQ